MLDRQPIARDQPETQSPETQYPCLYEGCEHISTQFSDLKRHYKTHKAKDSAASIDCPKRGCSRVGVHGFTRNDHLNQHLRDYHKQDILEKRNDGDPSFFSSSGREANLNEFFLDGKGIHAEVLRREIHKYLGPQAHFKTDTYNV